MRPALRPQAATALALAALFVTACDTTAQSTPDAALDAPAAPQDAPAPAAPRTATVDASRADAWVYYDLEQGAEVTPADPATSRGWDVAFQRFKIMTNGGVSGSGGVEVVRLAGVAFDTLTAAPTAGWTPDAADGADDDMDPDYAFNAGDGWYSYDPATHAISARDAVYIVRTAEGGYFKLQLTSYYDAANTSGHPTFRFAPVTRPTP